jgi:hypothetical protein
MLKYTFDNLFWHFIFPSVVGKSRLGILNFTKIVKMMNLFNVAKGKKKD